MENLDLKYPEISQDQVKVLEECKQKLLGE
jgi:hypothetical protein